VQGACVLIFDILLFCLTETCSGKGLDVELGISIRVVLAGCVGYGWACVVVARK
jgi:hypothetical protein